MVKDIARGRGTTPSKVRANFGKGRVVLAKDAVGAGMADTVATLDKTLSRILGSRRRSGGPRAAIETIRDFEAFLRDEGGFSNAEARRIALGGFKVADTPREAEEHAESAGGEDHVELKKLLQEFAEN